MTSVKALGKLLPFYVGTLCGIIDIVFDVHLRHSIKASERRHVLHGLAKIHASIPNCYNIGQEPKARDRYCNSYL